MPLFECKIINNLGEQHHVTRESTDEISLVGELKREGSVLLSCRVFKEKEPIPFLSLNGGRVKKDEVISFYRQFAVMVKASIPISDCLNVLRKQNFTEAFQKVLMKVYSDVQSGVLLSDAFKKHHKVFPDFFCNMVAIGEVSGSLDNVLESMADYYENDRKIKKKARSSVAYPIFLGVMVIIVIIFLMVYVIPKFTATLSEMGSELPGITLAIMAISDFFVNYWLYILVGIVVIVLVIFLLRKTKKGKYVFDWLKHKLPIFGRIERSVITARFSKAFIILIESGMNITDCLINIKKMLGNQVFEERFAYTIEEVKRGKKISQAIGNTKLFPSILIEMINVGERSGNISEVLKATSQFFDEQVESSISRAVAVLEPVMVVLLGAVVAVVVLAVLLPEMAIMSSI